MRVPLSSSQHQLIHLFASGCTDTEMAREMALSQEQIRLAFLDICEQLNLSERVELLLLIFSD